MENRPKVGLGVLILKDGKVLFGRRKGAHGENTWAPPGGHIEWMESFEDCARREVEEETGIKVKNIKFATATNDMFINENKHYITIFVTCEYDSGEVKLMEPDKCEQWKWVEWSNLPRPLFTTIENLLKQNYTPFL